MLTNEDLIFIEKYGCELGDSMLPELVQMARRYLWLRDVSNLSVRDVLGPWSKSLNDGLDAAVDQVIAESKD